MTDGAHAMYYTFQLQYTKQSVFSYYVFVTKATFTTIQTRLADV